jgi:DNA-binding NtrC family response regulator
VVPRGSLSVLIVDRDTAFAKAAERALTKDAFEVRVANDAATALAVAQGQSLDCVLLEKHSAPDFEAMLRMRRDEVLQASSIVVMVTPEGDVDPPEHQTPRVDLALRKPIDLELIGGLLRHLHAQRTRALRMRPTQ